MAQTTDAPPAPHMCGTRCIITLSTHLLRSSLPARLRNIIQPLGSCGAGDPGGTVGSCVDRQRASLGELPARSGDGEAPRGACYFFILRIFLKKLCFIFYKVFVLILFIIFCFVFLINFLSNFSTKIFVLNFFSKLFCFRTFDKSSFPFFDKLFVFF
jgi:hypothetical protein